MKKKGFSYNFLKGFVFISVGEMALEIVLFLGLVILIGYAANIFSQKTKIPESLIMIFLGLLIGPIFKFVDPAGLKGIAGTFATIAIVIILINSGLDFDLSLIMKKMLHAALFTVIANIMTTAGIGLVLHFFFGWNILYALLLGIVSSGTTTVMVQSLLESVKVNKDVKHLLVLESILNDTTLIIISVSIIELIKQNSISIVGSAISTLKSFTVQLVIAIIFSLVFFIVWLEICKITPAEKKKDYVFVLGLLFMQYGIVEFFGGSGIISVLAFSLLLGNIHSVMKRLGLKDRYYTRAHIHSLKSIKIIQLDFSFFIKTFFFIFLGIITDIGVVSAGLIAITFAVMIIIIATRFICAKLIALLDRSYHKGVFLISTMMPRGFVATLLAFLPYREGIIIPAFPEIIMFSIILTTIVSIISVMIFNLKEKPSNSG